MLRIRTMRPPVVGGRIVFADFYNRQLLCIKAERKKKRKRKEETPPKQSGKIPDEIFGNLDFFHLTH